MSVSILINKLTLCHKGDVDGSVTATAPDVCLTPPDGTPVPYPNVAFALDLARGTTTVFVDGGHMAGHSASVFATSTGDEPGTLGGIVSGVNRGEASWLSYSMDVFLEGHNACRLTDKMLLNSGNTVSMSFLTKKLDEWKMLAKSGADLAKLCEILAKMIEEILNGNKGTGTSAADGQRGLKERWYQQAQGTIRKGEPGWAEHEKAILDLQQQLRDHIKIYNSFCGGGPPLSKEVREWAHKPPPVDSTGFRFSDLGGGAVPWWVWCIVGVAGVVTGPLWIGPALGGVGTKALAG